MGTTTDHDRARFTTTGDTAGVRVRMTPEGLRKLAARGNVERLRLQIPRMESDQVAELLELVDPTVRAQIQDVQAAPPSRRGRPPAPAPTDSPVARARERAGIGRPMTKRELAQALGVRDSAVGNIEARGLAAAPPTIAKYLEPTGARLEFVVTHADGHKDRFPVAPDSA